MRIGEAIEAMERGERVRRLGWNASNQWLSMTPGNMVQAHQFWSPANREFALSQPGQRAAVRPYVTLKTADNAVVPWTCSQSDLLADDWETLL